MPKTITASNRKTLIRLASSMGKGSEERKAILSSLSKKADLPDSVFYDVQNLATEEAQTLWGYDILGHSSDPDPSEYRKANRELNALLKKIQRDHGEDALDEALDAVEAFQQDYKKDAYKRQGRNLPEPKRPRWASLSKKASPETLHWEYRKMQHAFLQDSLVALAKLAKQEGWTARLTRNNGVEGVGDGYMSKLHLLFRGASMYDVQVKVERYNTETKKKSGMGGEYSVMSHDPKSFAQYVLLPAYTTGRVKG